MAKGATDVQSLPYDMTLFIPVHWYVVCAIVAVGFVFLMGASVCVYQCYRRRLSRNSPENRLSAAIRKGLMKEYKAGDTMMTKSPSMRSATSTNSEGAASTSSVKSTGTKSASAAGTAGGGQPSGSSVRGVSCLKSPVSYPGQTFVRSVNETNQVCGDKLSPQEKSATDASEKIVGDDVGTGVGRLGTLHFSVDYDSDKTALLVAVTRAKDLPVKDPNVGSSDPYVKLQLLPDKRQKVKTRVLRKTLNPVYDEVFTFYGIDCNQLNSITLHFAVLSYDRFSRDDVIGEVIYPLADVEFGKSAVSVCKEISPRQMKMCNQGRGELLLSVCHQPAANRLTVVVLKARNLPKMDITGLSDPYVKIYLLYNGQRIAKKKTHVKKRTLNPVFNESFIFDLPPSDGSANSPTSSISSMMAKISLDLYVLEWDQMTKNDVIGRLEIGATSGEQESRHWNEVVTCPRKQIARWHKLKD